MTSVCVCVCLCVSKRSYMHKGFSVSWVSLGVCPSTKHMCKGSGWGVLRSEGGFGMGVRNAESWGQWRGWTGVNRVSSDKERQKKNTPSSPWPPSYTSSVCLTLSVYLFSLSVNAWVMPAERQITINGAFFCHLNVCACTCLPLCLCVCTCKGSKGYEC